MTKITATFLKFKAVSIANDEVEVLPDGKVQDTRAFELNRRILLDIEVVEEFLNVFVPCSIPYSTAQITLDPTATIDYQPGPGLEMSSLHPGLVSSLRSLK